MAIQTPTAVTTLPSAPTASDPSSFDTKGDTFVAALTPYQQQMNALASNVYNNAVEIASNIGASSIWISGSTYTVGTVRFSPLDNKNYRCIVATSGSDITDPSSDFTKWKVVVPNVPGNIVYISQLFGVF